jgi:4-hydroxybenzoate polyprenyltransferase
MRVIWSPVWLLKGKAGFKLRLGELVVPTAKLLPYNESVLDLIKEASEAGRPIVLATGANRRIAEEVARHLGVFTHVLASDETTNLTGRRKLAAIRELLGEEQAFDYVGDSKVDHPIFKEARRAYLVASRLPARNTHDLQLLENQRGHWSSALLKLIRPQQWAKNVLMFLPLILAQEVTDLSKLGTLFIAFAAFSLCASAGYVLNDSLDIEADRLHQDKRFRPLASGVLPLWMAPALFVVLLLLGGTLGYLVSGPFLGLLALYLSISLSYSFFLKTKLAADVIVLASLYTLRIFAGGLAAQIELTAWMLAYSLFFFTSLAFLKRYIEISGAEPGKRLKNRDYREQDRRVVESLGTSSGLLAVLVFALYINSGALKHYSHQEILWGICPVLMYWVTRLWLLAGRQAIPHDPVVFALKDRVSWMCAAVIGVLLFLASGAWSGS